jgi:hypothetical protein
MLAEGHSTDVNMLQSNFLPSIFQTSCFLNLTPAHSFQNEDGQFVNVSRAQYLPDKRNLHMRVLSGDYY